MKDEARMDSGLNFKAKSFVGRLVKERSRLAKNLSMDTRKKSKTKAESKDVELCVVSMIMGREKKNKERAREREPQVH